MAQLGAMRQDWLQMDLLGPTGLTTRKSLLQCQSVKDEYHVSHFSMCRESVLESPTVRCEKCLSLLRSR